MGQYKSQYTGPQIDAGINAALNPDVAVTPDSDALVTSGAVAEALENIDPTITSNTDTTLNGILVGDGGKVGAKSLDTSSLTNDADHVPVSSVVKSALDAKADKNDLATIHQTSPTCTETNGIAAGVFFYLDNELVMAKTAIANGATFTNGTNYESPTAGGLNSLMSAFGDVETETTNIGITLRRVGKTVFAFINAAKVADCTNYTIPEQFRPIEKYSILGYVRPENYQYVTFGYGSVHTNGTIEIYYAPTYGNSNYSTPPANARVDFSTVWVTE